MWPNASISANKNLSGVDDSLSHESKCFHCGLPVLKTSRFEETIRGVNQTFCCAGCGAVCLSIYESGLESYYDKARQNRQTLALPAGELKYVDQFDLEDVQSDFAISLADNRKEADFIVDGMHCAGCVWLIEKVLNETPGVELAEVNLSRQRLRMRWDQTRASLSSLIRRLSSFGYSAMPYNAETAEGNILRFNRRLLYKMSFAAFGVLNIMWISVSLYAGAFSGLEENLKFFFQYVSFAIATPVLLYCGRDITSLAFRGLANRRMTMDLPIAIGAWVTYGYSVWRTFWAHGDVYYDTVVTFLFIILVGRYLEAMSKHKACAAGYRLRELQPITASLVTQRGDERVEERVSVKKLIKGDKTMVRAGDKMPVDGIVLEGQSHVDESMLTGESKPVFKKAGSKVNAGSMNLNGMLIVETTSSGQKTRLSRIIQLAEAAQSSKANIQQFADRIVPWFVTGTLSLALITFLYWSRTNFDMALLAATSVLIITCPCALGMATPMSVIVGSGLGASLGFLVRDSKSLERLSGITHVVFDKTGTLTTGEISVTGSYSMGNMPPDQMARMAASLENCFQHPIASAITKNYTSKAFLHCSDARNYPGLGVEGMVSGKKVLLGNRRFLEERNHVIPASGIKIQNEIEEGEATAVFMIVENKFAGIFRICDKVREDARELLDILRKKKLKISVLTGDNKRSASGLQKKLGKLHIKAEMLPEDKSREISRLQSRGEKVLMIGDGINDAPAISRADVGIAMGSSVDVSMQHSDVVLIGDELIKVARAIQLGRTTIKTIYQNIAVSLVYNLFLVPAAMAGLVTPVFASAAMPISSLIVIFNSILIRRRMYKNF